MTNSVTNKQNQGNEMIGLKKGTLFSATSQAAVLTIANINEKLIQPLEKISDKLGMMNSFRKNPDVSSARELVDQCKADIKKVISNPAETVTRGVGQESSQEEKQKIEPQSPRF